MTTPNIAPAPLKDPNIDAIRKQWGQTIADNEGTGGSWLDPGGLFGTRAAEIQAIVDSGATMNADGTFNLNPSQRYLAGITDKDVAAALISAEHNKRQASNPNFVAADSLGIDYNSMTDATQLGVKVGKEKQYITDRDTLLSAIRKMEGGGAALVKAGLTGERPEIEKLQELETALRPEQTKNVMARETHKSNQETAKLNRDLAQQQEDRAKLQQQQSETRDRNNLAQQNWQNNWTKYTTELNQYNREADKLQRAHELQMARDERKEKSRLDYRLSVMDMEGRKEDREARREDRLAQQRMASIAQLIKGLTHMGAGMAI